MTPWVRILLLANVLMFFLARPGSPLYYDLVFVPALVGQRPWTAVTYMFLHAGFTHILFNMLGLYFFGSRLESRLGGPRLLTLYLVSGLTGAVVSRFLTPGAAIVGASGAIFGIMLGYARYWPRDLVYIWGVVPVPARVMVVLMTLLALFSGISGAGAGVAHFAHLGGFLGGLLYLTWVDRRSPSRRFREKAAPAPRTSASTADIERWRTIRQDTMHPLNREELERLLRKITQDGASRLTPDERAFLDRMSPN